MKHQLPCGVLLGIAVLATASWVTANPLPDFSNCIYSCATAEQVSVFSLPDGSGDPLSDCYLQGGTKTDATITLWVIDWDGIPVPDVPAEDMWLEPLSGPGGIAFCAGPVIADQDTDASGMTTFSHPLLAGGASTGPDDDVIIWIMGFPLEQGGGVSMLFNSPDINRDLVVNLSDVVIFAGDFLGSYQYRSDFYWDNVLNLSDVVLLARGLGTTCP